MRKPLSRFLVIKLLIGIMLVTVGCDLLPLNIPTSEPMPVPTASLEPEPTPLPTPTLTMPEGPYPPVIVKYIPRPGQEVRSDAAIMIQFDQPMDQNSVEAALRVSPEIESEVEWQSDSTVIFRPKTLASATRYQISLGREARSLDGLPLSTELAFGFSTLSPLEVTHVSPEDTSVDRRADAPLYITFNRPIVPLNCAGQAAEGACLPLPLSFSPAVLGDGMWVNTSLYRFDPLTGWAAGVTYEAVLAVDVASVGGARLAQPYTWSFSTALPFIQDIAPGNGQKNVPLDAGIRIVFNTPMDRDITGSVFSVRAEDDAIVPGAVTWEDNGAVLVFTPTQLLDLSTRYTVRVSERARAVTSAPLQNPQAWTFETAPYPEALGFTPDDGATGVRIYESVRISFGGIIDSEMLKDHVLIEPEPDTQSFYAYFDADSGVYHLSWQKEPRTEYCVTVQAGVADVYDNTLEEDSSACFTTGDLDPFVGPAMALDTITLDAQESALLYFFVRNQRRTSFALYQLDEANFVRGRWNAQGAVLREWEEVFDVATNEVSLEPVSLTRRGDPLDPGYYKLEWTTPQWGDRVLNIAVIDRHVTLKLAEEEAVVWITDLYSAEPITRTAVRLVDQEGLLIAAGTTNVDGLARIPISPRENLWDSVAAVVGEPGAPGFGVVQTHWQADATPWAFDIAVNSGPFIPFNAFLHTDRSIYRPGQTVKFRGILRESEDILYTIPPLNTPVLVALRDPVWDIVYSTTLSLSEMGTFDGVIPLSDDAALGQYVLESTVPGFEDRPLQTLAFAVAAYRKPAFEVTVTPELADVLQGESMRAMVQASYFFGGPVDNASLHWTVQAEPYCFEPITPLAGRWHWGLSDLPWYEPEVVAEGDAQTDEEGRFLVEVPARLATSGDDDDITSQRWTIEATLVDEGGFPVSGRGEATVHASNFYLGVDLDRWVVRAKDRATANVLAFFWDDVPVAETEVALMLVQRTWYQESAQRPFDLPTWGYTDTVVSTVEVTTNAEGQATAAFNPPHSGSYVVRVEASDTAGNVARAETSLWVSGTEAASWQMAEGKVIPVADAAQYQVGETANILLPTSFEGPYQVLMTVERGGVLTAERYVFDTPNPLIELPILETYAPNVYVSFVVARGVTETHPVPDVRAGYVELLVAPTEKALTVELVPDKSTSYDPGDSVALTVRTLDAAGQPVDAEVGLSLVDKAVLSLRKSEIPPILEAFYGERPLSIVMGDSLLVLFNRLVQELAALAEDADRLVAEMTAGGMGGGGDAMVEAPDVRQDFPDTALWEAHLRTGPSGAADVIFELPDSLTTWVAEARAVTADTKVGEARAELIVTKPLLVRPVTPRFFVIGDLVQVAAVVHNNTGTALNVTMDLFAEGLFVEGETAQVVAVPAGGRERVAWTLSVPQTSAESALLVFSAEGGGYQDASRPTFGETQQGIPIYRYETPDVMGTAGVLDEADSRLEAILVPADAGDSSSLLVRVETSLSAAWADGLTYLDRYPYETTDVLVGRFLPNILTYRVLQALGRDDVELEARLQTLIGDTLDRLYTRQNPDGGWGWWKDWSNMHLTSYVVLGLVQAQRAGVSVREDVLQRAVTYTRDTLQSGLQTGTRHPHYAFALYVLSEAGADWPTGAASAMYASRDSVGVAGQAYLALALGLTDSSDTRWASLLDSLRANAKISATGAHWEASDAQYWGTDIQVTAVALDALARLAPDDALLPQGVRWLLVARRGDHWTTTYETSWAIMALADYVLATGDLGADYSWNVALNGVPLFEDAVDADISGGGLMLRADVQGNGGVPILLRDVVNALEIARESGAGRLYYAAHLALARPVDQVTAESRGITIQREYCAALGAEQADEALCRPLAKVQPGDLLQVRLTLVLPETRYFVWVEDPYPAGFEPVDTTLKTESQVQLGEGSVASIPEGHGWIGWRDPFERRELRDDHAAFFASSMVPGTYQVTYMLRATLPGTYQVLPATASEMYFPEVWGRTAGAMVEVFVPAAP